MTFSDSSIAPANERVCLLGKSLEELRELAGTLGEPSYRASQIYHALYAERVRTIDEMSNLPMDLRRGWTQSPTFPCLRFLAATIPTMARSVTFCGSTVHLARMPRLSKPFSCPKRNAKRFASRPKQAAR